MPWWVILYFGIFCLLGLAGIWDDYRDQRPGWFLGCAVISNLIVAYLFVAYWQPALLAPLGSIGSGGFVAAMGWELFQAVEDSRALNTASEFPRKVAIATVIVGPLICLPAFIIAGVSAFRT